MKINPQILLKAIHAKCKECMGGYKDGRVDCEIKDCPLYQWMPYKEKLTKRKIKRC